MINLSDKLKAERSKRGLTQSDMAKLLDIKRSTYSLYESGKREPDLQTIRNFSAILKIYMGDLITDWSSFTNEAIQNDFRYGLPLDELGMLQDYRILNKIGKNEARKRVNELTEISKYRKDTLDKPEEE